MADNELKVKGVCSFGGLSIGKNKVVTLKVKLRYDEIVTSVNLMQGLHTDITVSARINGKVDRLGLFKVDGVVFDKDGNSVVTLKALIDQVELDNIVKLPMIDEEVDVFQILFKAVLELESNE